MKIELAEELLRYFAIKVSGQVIACSVESQLRTAFQLCVSGRMTFHSSKTEGAVDQILDHYPALRCAGDSDVFIHTGVDMMI